MAQATKHQQALQTVQLPAGWTPTPAYYVQELGWLEFVPKTGTCCAGCDDRVWDMFLTMWFMIAESGNVHARTCRGKCECPRTGALTCNRW